MSSTPVSLGFGLVVLLAFETTATAIPACPATFKDLPSGTKTTLCRCPPHKIGGAIYGTGIYTSDSSICAAAAHSGAIHKGGGMVTVASAPGCLAYKGTRHRGITSQPWSAYPSSFTFPQVGYTSCPDPNSAGTGKSDRGLARQYKPGDRVTCRWRGADKEYSGTVEKIRGGRLLVVYDDSDKELIGPGLCRKGVTKAKAKDRPITGPADRVEARRYRAGDRILCRWRQGEIEYKGVVRSINEGRLVVDYDDGSKETIGPGLCRREGPMGR